jgi:hypothetical protein
MSFLPAPQAHFLDDNLAALAGRMPGLARALSQAPIGAAGAFLPGAAGAFLPGAAGAFLPAGREGPEVSPSSAGPPTARWGGSWLHSRHDPRREAAAQVQRETDAETSTALVLGFGLGYAAEALLSLRPGASLLVIEPDPGIFLAALASRDLRGVLASPRCLLHVGSPAEDIPRLLEQLPLERPAFLRLRPEVEKSPEAFRQAEEVARSFLLRREINVNTLKRFGRLWVRNLCRNISAFADAADVDLLVGVFDGIPALVLAGGPTLDELAPLLPELAQRMVLVAVNTSLGPCLAAGVSPDVTVVVDPQYWASRSLDWAGPDPGSFLVAEPSTHPRVFRSARAAGSRVLLCGSLFPLGERLEAAVGGRGRLGAGGSVTTSAWDLARMMGCSPIYAAGLDLGFPGMRTHCRGAFFEGVRIASASRLSPAEGSAFAALREIGIFPVRSAGGGWTPTDRRMLLYKWWFENALAMRPGLEARTLSPHGAAIEGMRPADAAEALGHPPCRQRIDDAREAAGRRRVRGVDPGGRGALADALAEVLAGMQELERAAAEGTAANEALASALRSGGDRGPALDRLQAVDARILEVSSRSIAAFLIQPLIHQVQGGADTAGDAGAVLARSARIYEGIGGSARYHRDLLDRALAELRAGETG